MDLAIPEGQNRVWGQRHGWFSGRVPSCDKVVSTQRIFVTLPAAANRLSLDEPR